MLVTEEGLGKDSVKLAQGGSPTDNPCHTLTGDSSGQDSRVLEKILEQPLGATLRAPRGSVALAL